MPKNTSPPAAEKRKTKSVPAAKPAAPKAPEKKRKPLTPRQANFVKLMPLIAAGKLTVEAALKRAGFAESTAKQQKRVQDLVRGNSVMQEELKKAGLTEQFIAKEIAGDIKKLKPGRPKLGYLQTTAELIDAFPAKKLDHTLRGVDDLLDEAEDQGEHAEWSTPTEK